LSRTTNLNSNPNPNPIANPINVYNIHKKMNGTMKNKVPPVDEM